MIDIDLAALDVATQTAVASSGLEVDVRYYGLPNQLRATLSGYEKGLNGATVIPGQDSIYATGGNPVYAQSSAKHGKMGVHLAPPSSFLNYLLPNQQSCSWSFYARINSDAEPSSARSLTNLLDVADHSIGALQVKPGGTFYLQGPNQQILAKSRGNAVFGTGDTNWFRVDASVAYDAGSGTNYITYAIALDAESDTYNDVLSGVVTGQVAPKTVTLTSGTFITWDLDTFRFGSGTELLGAYKPDESLPLPSVCFTGASVTDGVIIKACHDIADEAKKVDFAVSTAKAMTSPTLAGVQTITADGISTHVVTGLQPNTRYYARRSQPVTGKLYGNQIRFKTAPPLTGAWTRKVAVVSCQSNDHWSPQAWDDILEWDADAIWHLGDYAYIGQAITDLDPYSQDIDKRIKKYELNTTMRAATESCSTDVIMISDHEVHQNGPQWGSIKETPIDTFGCLHTIRELKAFQVIQPVRSWGDTRNPRKHRAYAFDYGSKVRVIVTDFRCPERSMEYDPDGPNKQMWGANQEAFIFSSLDPTKLNILVGETSWWMSNVKGGAPDKYYSYPTAQTRLADKINGTGSFAGGPKYPAMWVGGDRHYTGYFNAAATLGLKIPQIVSSGMTKNSLATQAGEIPTWAWYPGLNVNQSLTFVKSTPPLSLYTITYKGATTAQISVTATPAQIQTALEALPTIGAGNVKVYPPGISTGDDQDLGTGKPVEYDVLIKFGGTLNTNTVPLSAQGIDGTVSVTKEESTVVTYMQMTINCDAAGKVTVSGKGRAVLDTSVPVGDWVMADIPGGTCSDNWTP